MIGAARPGFTHLRSGTAESAWREAGIGALPEMERDRVLNELGPGTLLLVGAAHPDDECLGAGGLMATALAAGTEVKVLLCTSGEASHPHSPSSTSADLGERRRAEFDRALRELRESTSASGERTGAQTGSLDALELGLQDGGLAARVEQIAHAANAIIRDSPARRVILAGPYRRDGHPDHDAVGAALARSALEAHALLLEFPIWFWHWADPEEDLEWRHWTRLPLMAGARRSKSAAIGAHASQLRPLSDAPGDEPVLGAGLLEHFQRDFEVFRVTAPSTRDSDSARREFDAVHDVAEDPWELRSSWYERRKLALMLAMLPAERSARALEIGCSIGESTAALAGRSTHIIAVDASQAAVALATKRLARNRNVDVVRATLPQEWDRLGLGEGELDLVVLSETGYYLAEDELCELVARSREALSPDGVLVLCHWRGPIVGWPLDGDRVHALVSRLGMRRLASYSQAETLIEVFENGDARAGTGCFAQPDPRLSSRTSLSSLGAEESS